MHLSDTLTLIDDALRESKIMLEIYASRRTQRRGPLFKRAIGPLKRFRS
jgi:hypothetical protein